jgi:hypothetical protein
MLRLLLTNLIILLNIHDYDGRSMIDEFKYFIKVRLLS